MSDDYYKILGISKDSSQDDIKKAYRKLAHKYHPDKKGGDEKMFKKVNQAYQVLSDAQKKQRYDMFGSGGNPGGGGFDFNWGQGRTSQDFMYDLDDILSGGVENIFNQFFGGQYGAVKTIIRDSVHITLEEAYSGVVKNIHPRRLSSSISVKIPAGINNASVLRIKQDNFVLELNINVAPHKEFIRSKDDIYSKKYISVTTAALGDKVDIKTLSNDVSLKIKSGTKSGDIYKLRGKGMPRSRGGHGDQYVEIEIDIPKKLSKKQKNLFKELREEGI